MGGPYKLFRERADKHHMTKLSGVPIRLAGHLLVCLALAACAAFAQEPKKVSKAEALNNATVKVNPEYPAMAKQLKLEGSVEMEAVVSETGAVEDVTVVSGNPVLTKSAAMALKRWKFSPFTEGGKPIKVVAPVAMNFKM